MILDKDVGQFRCGSQGLADALKKIKLTSGQRQVVLQSDILIEYLAFLCQSPDKINQFPDAGRIEGIYAAPVLSTG